MLGIFHSPPDIFSKGHFPECDVIKGGVGGCKYGLWGGGGENKDMKRVNSELSAYMNDLGLGKFLSFTSCNGSVCEVQVVVYSFLPTYIKVLSRSLPPYMLWNLENFQALPPYRLWDLKKF